METRYRDGKYRIHLIDKYSYRLWRSVPATMRWRRCICMGDRSQDLNNSPITVHPTPSRNGHWLYGYWVNFQAALQVLILMLGTWIELSIYYDEHLLWLMKAPRACFKALRNCRRTANKGKILTSGRFWFTRSCTIIYTEGITGKLMFESWCNRWKLCW